MDQIAGSKTSVHNGCFTNDYQSLFSKDPDVPSKYGALGTSPAMLANRISWFFDLTGPSVNLDSACSSSMMALDLACQGLWSEDTSMVRIFYA
jgi:acyl transferase domain-containing protein